MMTWKEFKTKNEDKAFELAVKLVQGRRDQAMKEFPHSSVLVAASDIQAEMNLILDEWFDDYTAEHV